MIDLNTLILGALLLLIISVFVLIFKVSSKKSDNLTPQLLDLKNQLNDLKTKQLETQNKALLEQQKLFKDTQQLLN